MGTIATLMSRQFCIFKRGASLWYVYSFSQFHPNTGRQWLTVCYSTVNNPLLNNDTSLLVIEQSRLYNGGWSFLKLYNSNFPLFTRPLIQFSYQTSRLSKTILCLLFDFGLILSDDFFKSLLSQSGLPFLIFW